MFWPHRYDVDVRGPNSLLLLRLARPWQALLKMRYPTAVVLTSTESSVALSISFGDQAHTYAPPTAYRYLLPSCRIPVHFYTQTHNDITRICNCVSRELPVSNNTKCSWVSKLFLFIFFGLAVVWSRLALRNVNFSLLHDTFPTASHGDENIC